MMRDDVIPVLHPWFSQHLVDQSRTAKCNKSHTHQSLPHYDTNLNEEQMLLDGNWGWSFVGTWGRGRGKDPHPLLNRPLPCRCKFTHQLHTYIHVHKTIYSIELLSVVTLYPILQVRPARYQPLPAVYPYGNGNLSEMLHRQLAQGVQESSVQL